MEGTRGRGSGLLVPNKCRTGSVETGIGTRVFKKKAEAFLVFNVFDSRVSVSVSRFPVEITNQM